MNTAQAHKGKGGDAFRSASSSYREQADNATPAPLRLLAIVQELALAAASAEGQCRRLGDALVARGAIGAGWYWLDQADEIAAMLEIAQRDVAAARRTAGIEHTPRPSDMIRGRRRQS